MIEGFSRRAAAYLMEEHNRLEIRRYVDIYFSMMRLLPSVDPASDAAFRRLYNVFYKLRFAGSNGHASAEIYDGYYRLLWLHRDSAKMPAVEEVLSELYALTGKVHLSFSSKLIATLYPDCAPVWDNNVRVLVGIPYDAGQRSDDRRLAAAADAYHALKARYDAFFDTAEAQAVCAVFDGAFPDAAWIAAWKKIDFLLWRMGSRRSRQTA